MDRIIYIRLILYIFMANFIFLIRASGAISDKEKNILEENSGCDPKRPNLFVDRYNLLGMPDFANKISLHTEFTYGNGPYGPSHWPKLFKQCAGKHQSPIDIVLTSLKNVRMQKLTWNNVYGQIPEMITVSNNGRTVVLKPKYPTGKQATIQGGPLNSVYVLDHVHFHWGSTDHKGSEHTINGKSFPMEMHAVHLKEKLTLEQAAKLSDGIAIVGYLFEIDNICHRAIQYIEQIFQIITMDVGVAIPLHNMFPMKDLAERFGPGYVTYNGSLTQPPCSEGVIWILSPYYIGISINQLRNFRRLYDSTKGLMNNFRPIQPLNNRTVSFVM